MALIEKIKSDIIVVGHFSKDRITLHGKERVAPGGAIYYSSFPLKQMGLDVTAITKIAEEDLHFLDEFKDAGIRVYSCLSKDTTTSNIVYSDNLDKRTIKVTALAEPFELNDIPDSLEAKYLHIGALYAGEVPADVVRKISQICPVSLDAQGFIRYVECGNIKHKDWEEKSEVLRYVNVLKVDGVEAEILTGEKNLEKSVKKLSSYGPKEIVLTSNNGVLVYADGNFYDAPFDPKNIEGRTGRGDTCIASYIGKRLTSSPEDSCKFAAALTSRKMEIPGPFKGKIPTIQ